MLLENNFQYLPNVFLAKLISRTPTGIESKLKSLRLKRINNDSDLEVHVEKFFSEIVDGQKIFFIQIDGKVSEYHNFIWRKNGYRIPSGHEVVFINKRSTDLKISNLDLYPLEGYDPVTKQQSKVVTSDIKQSRKGYFDDLFKLKEEERQNLRDKEIQEKKLKTEAEEKKWAEKFLKSKEIKIPPSPKGRLIRVGPRTSIQVKPGQTEIQARTAFNRIYKDKFK